MNLNPNHPVSQQADGQWHKLLAVVMLKQGLKKVELTIEDVKRVAAGNVNIVLDARGEAQSGKMTIRIVDDQEAERLAAEAGGRVQDN